MLSGQVHGLATCGRETLARFESPVYAALLSGQVRGRLPDAGLSYCRHFLEQGYVVVYSDKLDTRESYQARYAVGYL